MMEPALSVSVLRRRDRLDDEALALSLAPPRLSSSSSASFPATGAAAATAPATVSAAATGAMGMPPLRSCRSGPVAAAAATARPADGASLVATGALVYSEMRLRLRRSRTVSGNSNASTSSSSSLSSYVPTTSASASFPGLPPVAVGASLRPRALSQDVDEDMSDADADDDGSGSEAGASRPSDEFREALQRVAAPALPPAPYPVDPYHFYCARQASTEEVAAAIAELLAASDVESSFHALKCKFRCVKYVHYSHVEFVVRVYAHAGALLVEFQRRSGSVLLWDGLYHTLYHNLGHLVDFTAPACPQSGGQKRVAPAAGIDDDKSLGVQIWQSLTSIPTAATATPSSGVEAMKLMLTSKFVDAQKEGCSALAVLTEDPQNALLVAKQQLVEPLTRASEARDTDMARSATGALSNIALALRTIYCDDQQLAETVMLQLRRAAGIVLTRLEQRSTQDWSLYALELLRESARACGTFISTGVISDGECTRTARILNHYVAHRDRQLAVLCRLAMEKLDEVRRSLAV